MPVGKRYAVQRQDRHADQSTGLSRRQILRGLAALCPLAAVAPAGVAAATPASLMRPIPASGERIPIIGMGSWITFNVAGEPNAVATRVDVLRRFFEQGGGMIDSSPMYGSSEQVIGYCLEQLGRPGTSFSATKVWTTGRRNGIRQMQHSERLWRFSDAAGFDLMQIHNMVDWEAHLETLAEWKAGGRIRYVGITTSHGRRHQAIERALSTGHFDFVQFTYNIRDREAEARLLPLAAERGIAVIVNRPFRRGALFRYVRRRQLPGWAADIGCRTWAQYLLKFVVSHPAVTCVIPATSRVDHMGENMGAGTGMLPDEQLRQRMATHFGSL